MTSATAPLAEDQPMDRFSALGRGPANHVPLSPLGFLPKAAHMHPDRVAIIHGVLRQTWAQTHARCRRLASALTARGVARGETVAIIAPNTPAMVEAHFGVPMAGAVLNTLNTRLDPDAIAFQLAHGEARVLLVDREFSTTVESALDRLTARPLVIEIGDPLYPEATGVGEVDYEVFLLEGDPGADWMPPRDEFDPIALNYTSGTTGDPKGVVTHHRGAYLNAISQIVSWSMPRHPVYLWTLPLFHCNGWCFPWAVAAQAGTNICLRKVEAPRLLDMIDTHGVTHMSAAPIIYDRMIEAARATDWKAARCVNAMVAGAAPTTQMITGLDTAGFALTHVYGLTEVYGPAAVCVPQPEWADLPVEDRSRLTARQGFASVMQEEMAVLEPETLVPVAADGQSIGEIMFRGNIVMSGYLKNPGATDAAFTGGWFHTGDLAVVEPDGYARITDRSKDIIITGGENVSSIEVEDVLCRHPAVGTAAVVAKPDRQWGEVPCAFVELLPGQEVTASDLQLFCRQHLAGFKIPKHVLFGPVPRTATGKVQKFELRRTAADAVTAPTK